MKLNVEVPTDVEIWLGGKAQELKVSTEIFAASILEEAMLRDAETLSEPEIELLAGDVLDDIEVIDENEPTQRAANERAANE